MKIIGGGSQTGTEIGCGEGWRSPVMWNWNRNRFRNRWNREILSGIGTGIGIAKNFEVESESRKIWKVEINFSKVRKSVTKRLIISIEGAIIDIKGFYISF